MDAALVESTNNGVSVGMDLANFLLILLSYSKLCPSAISSVKFKYLWYFFAAYYLQNVNLGPFGCPKYPVLYSLYLILSED